MPTLTGDSVRLLLEQVAIDVESNKDFLCDLDGEVGDGDHGVSMTIGMRAVRRAMDDLPPDPSVEQAFQAASDAYAIEVGATIGPLYEVAFAAAAQACSGKADVSSVADWVQIYRAMFDAIQHWVEPSWEIRPCSIPSIQPSRNSPASRTRTWCRHSNRPR